MKSHVIAIEGNRTERNKIKAPTQGRVNMVALEVEDYIETFKHALDSVCVSLQITLDEDAANLNVPMEGIVREEVEEELERLIRLKGEIEEKAKEGPTKLESLVKERKSDIENALDFYRKRLEDGMKVTGQKDSFTPAFKRTHEEIALVKLARQALDLPGS